MSILKRLSLAAALLTFAGCASSSDPYSDDYFADDFAMQSSESEQTKPAAKKAEEKTAETPRAKTEKPQDSTYTANTQIVSEVSKKVAAIETKLQQIQENIRKNTEVFRELKNKNAEESRQYYEYVARIHARLQIGTTPGNPELTEMWKQASALLTGSDKNMSETAKLSSEIIRTKNELNSLLDTIGETFLIPGAMEIDHENLKALEDQANQTVVSLNRLSSDVSAQIARQQQYFSTESQNINMLGTDIQSGSMVNARPQAAVSVPAAPALLSAAAYLPDADLNGRRPLMVIRFNKKNVAYEQSLYKAVKAALDKRPNTNFEIVAVSPSNAKSGETEAAKNADAVRNSLISMGLPESRIYSSKTKSASIQTTEVHLYLK
ncbi:MAG: hypothetical protein J6L82_02390 [Alphaproteobacteria bacterium]|nr:hypothetical protein [Alphaproteobacteria bacterium]